MPVSGVEVTVPEGKIFEVLPKDVYSAELLDVEYKEGTKWMSEEKQMQLVFTFVILEEGEHYGRRMWQYCTQSLSKFKGGSNLYKTLVGLNGGVEFTDAQCANPDSIASDEILNGLIGKQVRLTIGQKEKQDKTLKNTIESYLPIKKELPPFDESKIQDAPVAAEGDLSFDS